MFRNVLIGIDGTPHGRDAIALARRIAAPGAELTLVHVHAGEHNRLHAIRRERLEQEQRDSEALLEDERRAAGVGAEIRAYVAESPGAGLHRLAEELGADLIVVGSTSHGAVGRVALGDDARAALNGSPCAVAIAARGYEGHAEPIAGVGVGYNDSAEAQAALQAAHDIAAPTAAAVRLLEVISIPSYSYSGMMAPVGEGIELMLSEAKQRIDELPGVTGTAVFGLAGEELAAFGEDVDVLVVGSRSYGPLRRLVLGSTSEYLERKARCSLLVLPRSAAHPGGEPDAAAADPAAA